MRIFAIDPGLTIGYALYNTYDNTFEAGQSTSHLHVINWLEEKTSEILPPFLAIEGVDHTFIVENYLSAGHLTKEAMKTIKLVGFFELYIDRTLGDVELAPPQRRLSAVAQAKNIAEAKGIPGPHSWDALAHAIVAARQYEG